MKKIIVVLGALFCLEASALQQIKLQNLVAYDGDTVKTSIRPFQDLPPLSIRVRGIDTPEIRGKCLSEKARAQQAKQLMNNLLRDQTITVVPYSWDKYGGRVVADLYDPNNVKISDIMIREGLARPYNGGAKASWCNQ